MIHGQMAEGSLQEIAKASRPGHTRPWLERHPTKCILVGGARERLQDNTQTPFPEQVAFRCDFREWLRTRSHRDRRLIRDLARDERASTLARKYQITLDRVSRLRRDCHDDWERFCADPAEKYQADAVLV